MVFLDAEDRVYEEANVFVLAVNPDGCHFTVGQVQLPLLAGSPEQQQAQVQQLSYIGIKVLAKLVMTPQRLLELRNVINGQLKQLGLEE